MGEADEHAGEQAGAATDAEMDAAMDHESFIHARQAYLAMNSTDPEARWMVRCKLGRGTAFVLIGLT